MTRPLFVSTLGDTLSFGGCPFYNHKHPYESIFRWEEGQRDFFCNSCNQIGVISSDAPTAYEPMQTVHVPCAEFTVRYINDDDDDIFNGPFLYSLHPASTVTSYTLETKDGTRHCWWPNKM